MLEMTSERSLLSHFSVLEDPRSGIQRRHLLTDMVVIAMAAVLCGADGWVQIAQFGRAKRAWLEQFLTFPNGIPAHDTFGRVFARLNPIEFPQCFVAWVQALVGPLPSQVVAVDGKTLRHSADRAHGRDAVHLVSAWATVTASSMASPVRAKP